MVPYMYIYDVVPGKLNVGWLYMKMNMETHGEQSQLGVPHSDIQVELDWELSW